jgi:hypothetical protein
MRLAIEASFLMRQEYERQENERLKAEEIARKHKEDLEERERKALLIKQRTEREELIKRKEQEEEENHRR